MKKREALAILSSAIAAVILLTGCTAKTQETPVAQTKAANSQQTGDCSVLPEEDPAWRVVSTAPEDFGIVYDDASMVEINDYPLDKLAAYLLGSDGVYAEGAHEEFYQRFLEAPDTVMSHLALVDEQSRQTLCWAVVSADIWWYKQTERFQKILDVYSEVHGNGEKEKVLKMIKTSYQDCFQQWSTVENSD